MNRLNNTRMMRITIGALAVIVATLLSATVFAQTVKADHTTININKISKADMEAAKALRISTDVASVGLNVKEGLDALKKAKGNRYSFPNWRFNYRRNKGWENKLQYFVDGVAANIDKYDIFAMKFCWVDSWDVKWETYRDTMLRLEKKYPKKTFVWWTMPLWGEVVNGNNVRAAYNASVREFCKKNNKPLFDIADISSHDPEGRMETIGGYEALYSGYTPDKGHFNALGSKYLARAFWNLMVQLATAGKK